MQREPPEVYVADDIDTLYRGLALQVVAATPGSTIPVGQRERIREAIVDERWGDAVSEWRGPTFPSTSSQRARGWTGIAFAEPEVAGLELRLQPLVEND